MIRLFSSVAAAGILIFIATGVAHADDEDLDSEVSAADTPVTAPTIPAAPTATAAPGTTDHDQTIGAMGFEITSIESAFGATVPMLGIRKWSSRTSGWELGATVTLANNADDSSDVIFGASFGLLGTLGIYKHMVVFWEPTGTLLVVTRDDGNDLTDEDPMFLVDARFSVGAEIRLGGLGLPRIGMTTRISAGARIVHDGDNTAFVIGNMGGAATSFDGLLAATVGFVFYR